jgi:hypothetical protein
MTHRFPPFTEMQAVMGMSRRKTYCTRDQGGADVFEFIAMFYNCSSERTSPYIVNTTRSFWLAPGTARCLSVGPKTS